MTRTDGEAREVGKAVAIAALSSLATALVTWAIDEIRARSKRGEEKHS